MLIPKIGTELIPEEDTGDLNLQVELPVGTRVEETHKIAQQVEAIIENDVPETQTLFYRAGVSGAARFGAGFGYRMGSNVINLGIKLILLAGAAAR